MNMNMNHLWIIVSASFVFFMQAGFVGIRSSGEIQ